MIIYNIAYYLLIILCEIFKLEKNEKKRKKEKRKKEKRKWNLVLERELSFESDARDLFLLGNRHVIIFSSLFSY